MNMDVEASAFESNTPKLDKTKSYAVYYWMSQSMPTVMS